MHKHNSLKKQNKTMIEKIANECYMYVNGDTLAKVICVPDEKALSDWKLITQEEADKIVKEKQEQEEQGKLDEHKRKEDRKVN